MICCSLSLLILFLLSITMAASANSTTERNTETNSASNFQYSYHSIALLPDEMIKYELESQGLKSAKTLNKRRKQLSNLISSRNYRRHGLRPIIMGFKENHDACTDHLSRWIQEVEASAKTSAIAEAYLIRLEFLNRRIDSMVVPPNHGDWDSAMRRLKDASMRFERDLKVMIKPLASSDGKNIPRVRNVDEWTMRDESMMSSPNFLLPRMPSVTNEGMRSRLFQSRNDSLLNMSLSFQGDASNARSSQVTMPQIIDSTHRPFDNRNVTFGAPSTTHGWRSMNNATSSASNPSHQFTSQNRTSPLAQKSKYRFGNGI